MLRLSAAAEKGNGGVELWFRKKGFFVATGFGELSHRDLHVWDNCSRCLALTYSHPALHAHIVALYAPQAAR